MRYSRILKDKREQLQNKEENRLNHMVKQALKAMGRYLKCS